MNAQWTVTDTLKTGWTDHTNDATEQSVKSGRITALQHDLDIGDYVVISRYTDHVCYRTKWVRVMEVRVNAVKVQYGETLTAWIPKKALVIDEMYYRPNALRLASWFTPNKGYNVIENLGTIHPY